MEITKTQLDHINTICENQLKLFMRIKRINDAGFYDQFYEAMCINTEIIQEIVRKVKNS